MLNRKIDQGSVYLFRIWPRQAKQIRANNFRLEFVEFWYFDVQSKFVLQAHSLKYKQFVQKDRTVTLLNRSFRYLFDQYFTITEIHQQEYSEEKSIKKMKLVNLKLMQDRYKHENTK